MGASVRITRRGLWAAIFLVVLVIVTLLPATAQSRIPPETDGSTYTWQGAATLTVGVEPWGGGYVRSDPYKIDCPLACIRPFDDGQTVQLTAYMTPGHTFKAWEGACAGQGNPCTLKASGLMEVTAVLEGHYVPPQPSSSTSPTVSPSLASAVTGACPGCTVTLTGTGYHPNSSVSIEIAYSSPSGVSGNASATSDSMGAWSYSFTETCVFSTGPFTGAVERDVTATDSQGAAAITHVSTTCP